MHLNVYFQMWEIATSSFNCSLLAKCWWFLIYPHIFQKLELYIQLCPRTLLLRRQIVSSREVVTSSNKSIMISSRRTCMSNPNNWYFICGEYLFKKYRSNMSVIGRQAYNSGKQIKIHNKHWICCVYVLLEYGLFLSILVQQSGVNIKSLRWLLFLNANITGIYYRNRSTWINPSSQFAVRPALSPFTTPIVHVIQQQKR